MPRTNMGKPEELVRIEQELREFVDGARYMSLSDIRRSLGVKNDRTVYEVMKGFAPLVLPSGRKFWKVVDVARMEYMRTTMN